jgi:hypothetical protein
MNDRTDFLITSETVYRFYLQNYKAYEKVQQAVAQLDDLPISCLKISIN